MMDERINDAINRLPTILGQNLNKNLCTCNEVAKLDIIKAIVNGATTVEAVRKETYATLGTGCCTLQVERLIECLCAPVKKSRRKRKRT